MAVEKNIGDYLALGAVFGVPVGAVAIALLTQQLGLGAPLELGEIEVSRAIVKYRLPPEGQIIGVSPPDGSFIRPGTSFEIRATFKNTGTMGFMFYARFIGRGTITGTTHFDKTTSPVDLGPGETTTFSSGPVTMPDEPLEVTIIVYGGA